MKIKEGFILREVADSFIVVAIGDAVKSFNGVINLNETSALLWKTLEKGAEKEDLVNALLNNYEVERELAETDVEAFITKLTEAGLIK